MEGIVALEDFKLDLVSSIYLIFLAKCKFELCNSGSYNTKNKSDKYYPII